MKNPLIHGGQLKQIAQQYNIAISEWLDLSTGIAPFSYTVDQVPEHIWRRLPEENSELVLAAKKYYRCTHILPTSGSQAVIQQLPKIIAALGASSESSCIQNNSTNRVYIPQIGYQEHRKAWQSSHFTIINYQEINQFSELKTGDVVVLINPNNPSGKLYKLKEVIELFTKVKQAGALLVIDEAFMDCTPNDSFIQHSVEPQLIVLRSVGKFFGLAGLRLGFVAAAPFWLEQLSHLLGPWSVNGPAQYIGQKALLDIQWQQKQRDSLQTLSQQLKVVLTKYFNISPTGTSLFQTIEHNRAPQIFHQLCQQGIYVRLCDEQNALRFGTPTAKQLIKLEKALTTATSGESRAKGQ